MPLTVAQYRDRLTARGWDPTKADTLAFAVARLVDAARELADIEDPIADGWSGEVQVLADHILTDRRTPEDRGTVLAPPVAGPRWLSGSRAWNEWDD